MATEVARHFQSAIRWSFYVSMSLVSVLRLLRYAKLPAEEKNTDSTYNENLSLDGSIKFTDVVMRYQAHLEPALRGLTFELPEGERFAVVGRTGAGKSSLFQVLQGFREPSQGAIKIGGEDVANLTKK